MGRFNYSRWDGTQVGFDLDADAILAEITDDLVHHGDVNAALRRLMQQGFQDRDGRQVQGMRELLDKLRQQRKERLENNDLGGVYSEIADQLKNGHKNTEKMQKQVCAVAQQAATRGPAGPSLSEVLGSSAALPEAQPMKKGGSTFDTLNGNVLTR